MRSARRWWGALLVATLSLSSCADDEPLPAQIPCDIREAGCRGAIFQLTAQLRGQDDAVMPPARIITRAQFAEETRAALAMFVPSRELEAYEAVLRMLRLLPADSSFGDAMTSSSIAGVAAYYDDQTKAITIIDDAAADSYSGSITLSHEYTHALQDQREGIAEVTGNARSTDEQMAVNALIEGEATILSDATLTYAAGMTYLREDVLSYMARMLGSILLSIEKSAAPFNQALLVLPYPIGGLPVANAYLSQGSAGVRSFYKVRPSSLIGWVQLAQNTQLPLPLRCDAPDAPSGYVRTSLDRVGGTGLIALYTRLGLSGSDAFDEARAWTNDSLSIFGTREDALHVAYAWRIGFVSEAAAIELQDRLARSSLAIATERQGRELVLSGADDAAVASAWNTRGACSTEKSRAEPRSVLPALPRYLAPHSLLASEHAGFGAHAQ
ncbi:MAG: hypothetical protein JWN48_514 [Myxococcaceae bacterium]|nr:hypothetical protein [Myxococcaceae bacterium]